VAVKRLRLTVLTPAGPLLDVSDVAWVQARLADGGGLGVYPGHAPLLAETQTAALRYGVAGKELQTERLAAGVLRVTPDRVWLLTGGATSTGTVDARAPDAPQSFERLAAALLAAEQLVPLVEWDEP